MNMTCVRNKSVRADKCLLRSSVVQGHAGQSHRRGFTLYPLEGLGHTQSSQRRGGPLPPADQVDVSSAAQRACTACPAGTSSISKSSPPGKQCLECTKHYAPWVAGIEDSESAFCQGPKCHTGTRQILCRCVGIRKWCCPVLRCKAIRIWFGPDHEHGATSQNSTP